MTGYIEAYEFEGSVANYHLSLTSKYRLLKILTHNDIKIMF